MIVLTTSEIKSLLAVFEGSRDEYPELKDVFVKLEKELNSPHRTYLEHTLYTRLDSDSSQ